MSIQIVHEQGDSEGATPLCIVELQQIVLGMFFIWDALGEKNYRLQELVESGALSDWARKHEIDSKSALEILVKLKDKFIAEPFCAYVHVRDFAKEGWADMLIFNPKNNQDVLDQIVKIHSSRPF